MKFRIRFADQVVGLFVIIAALALAAIVILGGINQRWFSKNYHYNSRFYSGSGLSVGMGITFKGFTVGKVSKISLNDDNLVDIDFYIYDTFYEKVKENTILELTSSPIGLGGGLIIHPGNGVGAPLPENSFIPSRDFPEAQRLIEDELVDIPKGDDTVTKLIGSVDPIIGQVSVLMNSVNTLIAQLNGSDSKAALGPVATLLRELKSTLSAVTDTVKQVNEVLSGTQSRAFELMDGVKTITDDVQGITTDVKTITGNIAQTTEALTDPTGIVQKLIDPKGSIATILNDDDALYDQINGILSTVNELLGELKSVTSYLNDSTPQISAIIEQGRNTLTEANQVLEGVKNNPLISGGITQQKIQPVTRENFRDEDFTE